jgi:preprotein translocase subunit SecG
VFGGSGAGTFLRKLTAAAAVTFMLTSMTLAWLSSTSGADALKQYSADQRAKAARREQEAQQVRDKDTPAKANDKGQTQTPPSTPDTTSGANAPGTAPPATKETPTPVKPGDAAGAGDGAKPEKSDKAEKSGTDATEPAQKPRPAANPPGDSKP